MVEEVAGVSELNVVPTYWNIGYFKSYFTLGVNSFYSTLLDSKYE